MVVASAGNLPSVKLLSSPPLTIIASSFTPTGWQPALLLYCTSSLEQGVTPLMVVASAGNLPAVKLLLEAAKGDPALLAAVVDATTENGTAAIHTAARQV